MPPHTETSYIPDLTQGKFQPLEEADDEWLEKIDLEAIIKSVESMTAMVPVSQQEVTDHDDTLMMNMSSKEKTVQSYMLPLLKLHPAVPKKKEVKAWIIPPCQFLPPVMDSQVDDAHFKR